MKNSNFILFICLIALCGCVKDDENEAALILANEKLSGDWVAISYEKNNLELIPLEIDSFFIAFDIDAMAKTGDLRLTSFYINDFSNAVTAGLNRTYTIISDSRLLTSRIDTVQYLVENGQLTYEYTSNEGDDIQIILVK